MAHNTRARANQTAWETGAVLPEEFEKLDQNAFASINGDDGGIWAPAEAIVIGGAGLEVSGLFLASGDAQIGDSSNDGLGVFATADFGAPVTMNDDVTIGSTSGDTLLVLASAHLVGDATTIGDAPEDLLDVNSTTGFHAEVDFDDDVDFNAGATFAAPVTFADDVVLGNDASDVIGVFGTMTVWQEATFDNAVTMEDDLDVAGFTTLGEMAATSAGFEEVSVATALVMPPGAAFVINEAVTFSTKGRVKWRHFSPGDANEFVKVTDGNVIVASLSTSRSYQIDDTDAENGDWFIFYNPTVYNLDILDVGVSPATLVNNLVGIDASNPGFAVLMRAGGNWTVVFRRDAS